MAQAGYTPISLYYSTTASAAPTAGNLVSGELAINITDGKLYYKDNGGVVQLIAGKGFVTETGTQTLTNKTISYADNTLTGVVGLTATQTLTNKTISYADNTLTGVVGLTATQTLTNKTISADDNTLSGIAASSFVLSNASGNIDGAAAQKAIPSGAVVGTTDSQTLTNKTLTSPVITSVTLNDGYTEEVFAISDGASVNLDPNNGSIQTWTLGGNRTPGQANWSAGQSITLMIDDGSAYSITWSTLAVVWKTDAGAAPSLNTTGYTVIVLWKVATTIYGARVGDA